MKHDPDSVRRARESRKNQTSAEEKLWSLLRNRRLVKRKFRRQYPIGPWVADFACPAVKLVIEVDGPSHDTEDQQAWDEMKTEYLRTSGWRVMRIKNADVYQVFGEVEARIIAEIGEQRLPCAFGKPHPALRATFSLTRRRNAVPETAEPAMISPNGIAHIQLTVRDVAASRPFYHKLLVETFGMAIQYDVPGQIFYCIGARTGVLIRNAAPEHQDTPFDQWRVGLHHFCFRLRSREDVDALAASMQEFGANIIRVGEEGPWAPGYYSTLFEDPDGIRIEALFIPGSGNLDRIKDAPLTPVG